MNGDEAEFQQNLQFGPEGVNERELEGPRGRQAVPSAPQPIVT
jgi:hypothetical protein